MLLAVEHADFAIVHVSANCADWLQQAPENLLGRSLSALLAPGSAALLHQCLAEGSETSSSSRTLQFAPENGEPVAFLASAHRSGDTIIIELERPTNTPGLKDQAALTLLGQCRVATRRLGQCQTVEELCQVATHELRSLTGYDRIMVYRFDEGWNGSVIAETREESLEPFLGLHYPATDIPLPARALFHLNGLRVIPDVNYQPVPLFPSTHPRTGQPLDLSRAQLRSASPIHREYLRNMEVGATLTISLLVAGELWGLIACHHRSPRFPSPTLREVCELFGQMASLQVAECMRAAGKKVTEQSKDLLRRLADRVKIFSSITPALLLDQSALLALANAQGAILWRDGQALQIGATPPLHAIPMIQEWVAKATDDPIFYTDSFPRRFPGAQAYADVASGLLAVALARSPDLYILWFRQEVIRTVNWAGDPGKSIEPINDDGRLHPRRSFALWKESVRYRSLPWLPLEVEAILQLRSILQDRLAGIADHLHRLLPICAWCKKVRSDQNYWQRVEDYVAHHTDIRFTHGVCPECTAQNFYRPEEPGTSRARGADPGQ